MIELTSRQRKVLEKHAQSMSALIQVGQGGVSEQLTAQVKTLLDARELVKVKFNEFKDEKQDLASKLAADCDAALVRVIGNVVTLYKPAEKADKRQYEKELNAC